MLNKVLVISIVGLASAAAVTTRAVSSKAFSNDPIGQYLYYDEDAIYTPSSNDSIFYNANKIGKDINEDNIYIEVYDALKKLRGEQDKITYKFTDLKYFDAKLSSFYQTLTADEPYVEELGGIWFNDHSVLNEPNKLMVHVGNTIPDTVEGDKYIYKLYAYKKPIEYSISYQGIENATFKFKRNSFNLISTAWNYPGFDESAILPNDYDLQGQEFTKYEEYYRTHYNDSFSYLLGVPTKENYTFSHWVNAVTNEDLRLKKVEDMLGSNITVKAIWKANPYKITYQNCAYVTNPNPTSFSYDDGIIELQDLQDTEGYKFLGWYNGDKKVTYIDSHIKEDVVLTAKAEKTSYKMKVYSSSYMIKEFDFDLGTEISLTPYMQAPEGYEVKYDVDFTTLEPRDYAVHEILVKKQLKVNVFARNMPYNFDIDPIYVDYGTTVSELDRYIDFPNYNVIKNVVLYDYLLPENASNKNASYSSLNNNYVFTRDNLTIGVTFENLLNVSTRDQFINALEENKRIKLTNDIDFYGYPGDIPFIESFLGVIDGDGHIIKNFTVSPAGFIENLTGKIINLDFKPYKEEFGLAPLNDNISKNLNAFIRNNKGLLQNVNLDYSNQGYKIDLKTHKEGKNIDFTTAFFVSNNQGSIINCKLKNSHNTLDINVSYGTDAYDIGTNSSLVNFDISMFVGVNNGKIEGCSTQNVSFDTTIDITRQQENWQFFTTISNVSGFVGTNNSIITNCQSDTDINEVGGNLLGYDNTVISDRNRDITMHYDCAGLVRVNNGELTLSASKGTIDIENMLISPDNIIYFKNYDFKTTVSNLVGTNNANISECFASGALNIGATRAQVSGLVNTNNGNVKNCECRTSFTNSRFTDSNYAGFVSTNKGRIENCISDVEMDFTLRDEYKWVAFPNVATVAGFCGYNDYTGSLVRNISRYYVYDGTTSTVKDFTRFAYGDIHGYSYQNYYCEGTGTDIFSDENVNFVEGIDNVEKITKTAATNKSYINQELAFGDLYWDTRVIHDFVDETIVYLRRNTYA